MLCEVDTINPPEFHIVDVMADSLSEVLGMLERGRVVIGREVDTQGQEKEDALFIPAWRVSKVRVIGMGSSMRFEFSYNQE